MTKLGRRQAGEVPHMMVAATGVVEPTNYAALKLGALGGAIRALRKTRGMSQEELAHLSRIDRSYMSSVERGTQKPGVMAIVDIARAMDLTLTELAAEAGL